MLVCLGEASRSSGSTHPAPARLLFLSSLHLSAAVAMGENSAAGKDAKGKAPAPTPTIVPDEAYLEAVTQKQIRLFEEIQTRQALERLNIGGEPIKITLPDGVVKEGKKWISIPMDIAKDISSGLAASCLIAQVNGTLWDMARPLEGNCELKLFKFDSTEGRDTLWHSSAHILGKSLERAYGCKLYMYWALYYKRGVYLLRVSTFYYDAYYNDVTLNEAHFGLIQTQAQKAVAEKQPFEHIEVSRAGALEMFAENKFTATFLIHILFLNDNNKFKATG